MKTAIVFLLLSVVLISCKKEPDNSGDDIQSLISLNSSSAEYKDAKNGNSPGDSDPFVLNDILIDGDSAFISVSYSGGCKQHSFEIIWSEEFSNTIPPSTGLIINHDANDDNCEAYITETLVFNINELTDSILFDTVCVNIVNGVTLSDSLSSGGWDPSDTTGYDDSDYEVVFPEGDICGVEVTATRVICGAGLYENLWFALNDSVSTGIDGFHFRKYLQPVAVSEEINGFIPVQGRKYLIGARIQNVHPYSGAMVCLAYSGPSVPVRITCIKELK